MLQKLTQRSLSRFLSHRASSRPVQLPSSSQTFAFKVSRYQYYHTEMAEEKKESIDVEPGYNKETPWNDWNLEMPTCSEEVKCPEFESLNSRQYLREILTEVRNKVFDMASKQLDHNKNGAILLAGGKSDTFNFYDNDTLIAGFRQEPFFRYIFGCNEPDLMGLMDLDKKEVILFLTPCPLEAERWMGKRRTFSWYEKEYALNNASPIQQLDTILKQRGIKYLYLLNGKNSDSDLYTTTTATFDNIKDYIIDYKSLHPLLCESRVIKTKTEINLLRKACLVSSKAHVYVMRHIKPKMSERQLEALFKGFTYYYGGARHQAYECICGSGHHGSILHYGHAGYPNDKVINDGETVVLDMGSEYLGYATDITCSYPVNGKFTDKQRMVHNAVVDANRTVCNTMKPGVLWTDMHRLSETIILKHLYKNMKILKYPLPDIKSKKDDDIIDYFMSLNVASMFMPHGLGHFLGMTVHDVGGYNEEYPPSDELGLCWLRTTRKLEEGMVITVEPGLYFNTSWIKQMMTKYPKMGDCVDKEVIENFYGCGGCRIEDDVLVTKDGISNLTIVPRSCSQIEQVMKASKV